MGGGVQAVVGAKREHKQSKHKFDRKRELEKLKEREREKKSWQSQRTSKNQGWVGEKSERGGQSSDNIR